MGAAPDDYYLPKGEFMTTEDLMKLADKFAFFMPGSEEGEKARQALLDALQAQAERIKQDKSHIEMLERAAEEFMRDRDTLRAKLADLQVDDELPEPAVGFDYDYYEGLIRYEAPVPRFCETSYYTADQLRQAQSKVRAKMVPLEKDAARYLHICEQDFKDRQWVDGFAEFKKARDTTIDAAMGITGEPK